VQDNAVSVERVINARTTMLGGLVGGRIWRYELIAAERDGMRATVERIAGLLEQSS
jgi:hypothetical protein